MALVIVGEISGSYGVKGWVKVRSYTDPPENILRYRPWMLEQGGRPLPYQMIGGKPYRGGVIAALENIESPERARELRGATIMVDRAQFPPAGAGEYYRVDLIGTTVRNLEGRVLGLVRDVMTTGANDVLVVQGERERLIPFVLGHTVKTVDLQAAEILVDWDEDF